MASSTNSSSPTSTSTTSFNVKDKIVLVTGSNRGIGLSIIEGFLRAGATKAYAGVRTLSSADGLVQSYGSDRVVPLQMDMSDPATIRRAAEIAQDVDLVVNNAGILDIAEPLGENVDEDGNSGNADKGNDAFIVSLEKQMNVNVFGLVHMAHQFGPILERHAIEGRGKGAFIQINSTSSLRCPASSFSGYAASKAASFSITQGLLGSLPNTLVLSVHPGPIATDMVDQFGGRDRSEPPRQVFEAIVDALEDGNQFMVYTDTFSRNMGEDYKDFAQKHVTGKRGY